MKKVLILLSFMVPMLQIYVRVNCLSGISSEEYTKDIKSIYNTIEDPRVIYESLNQGTWNRVKNEQLEALFGQLKKPGYIFSGEGIRSREIYIPKNLNKTTQRPTVVILVHGTFASNTPEYHDQNSPFYQGVLNFAVNHAEKTGQPIDVISFRWSGKNSSSDRIEAAKKLINLLKFYLDNNYETITIAHSHGANLVNHASQLLPDNKQIDHIIHFAAPVRDTTDLQFKPMHFKRLTQFYSTSDLTAATGSVVIKWSMITKKGSVRKFQPQDNKEIINIRTQINGKDPGHSEIKAIINYLPEILEIIKNHYPLSTDLHLDVNTNPHNSDFPVIISIRKATASLESNSPQDKEAFKDELQRENKYSIAQKEIYRQRYNHRMDSQKNVYVRHSPVLIPILKYAKIIG